MIMTKAMITGTQRMWTGTKITTTARRILMATKTTIIQATRVKTITGIMTNMAASA
ncbi:hypothetical protein GL4_0913 [Methyloceanibacter caenitepidi]|uniref:Uncharacterized protein n=1 Tax=Methyloceanibacter caenitepidi TaxID=1384459 RepID=A0A0A8K097_9HYPH|nr:hypothetical protein GL4_0913 [Methyloceanibacter caenitepidi]